MAWDGATGGGEISATEGGASCTSGFPTTRTVRVIVNDDRSPANQLAVTMFWTINGQPQWQLMRFDGGQRFSHTFGPYARNGFTLNFTITAADPQGLQSSPFNGTITVRGCTIIQ